MQELSTAVAVLVALSVASERLVEIIKGIIPPLGKKIEDNATTEGFRKAGLQALAVVAGIITAWLAQPAIQEVWPKLDYYGIFALGLLASGGSGFWNSIATYLLKLKDFKGAQVDQATLAIKGAKIPPAAT